MIRYLKMHKITIKPTRYGYSDIFIDDKLIEEIVSIKIEMSAKNLNRVFIEIITDKININIPIEELQLKTPKKRYELIDIKKE